MKQLTIEQALQRGLIPGARATDAFGRTWTLAPSDRWAIKGRNSVDRDHMIYSSTLAQWAVVIKPAAEAFRYTGPDGQEQVMYEHEADAIMRSGMCDHIGYAAVGTKYTGNDRPWDAMDARPGQTKEATRVEQVECDRWKPLERHKLGLIHCNDQGGTLCSESGIKGSLNKVDFLGALTNVRVCPECADKYRFHPSPGRIWTSIDDAILAKWWKYTTMRMRVSNVLNRSLKACKDRYNERHR
jgi:hypothetical protein